MDVIPTPPEPLTPTSVLPEPVGFLDRREPADEAEIRKLGERIAELSALLSATEYQLLVLIREFDQRHGWRGGFASCAHWLNWRTGLAMGAARERVRVARALAELPRISAAMRDGELSFSKVRALTRVATEENEERLLEFAHAGTAAHVERLVQAWRAIEHGDDAEAEAEAARHADRHLHLTTDADGMVLVRGRLDPETGAALMRALEAAEQVLFDETAEAGIEKKTDTGEANRVTDRPSAPRRRADAIGRVAEAALAAGLDQGTRGDRYQVVVHMEAAGEGSRSESGSAPSPGRSHEKGGLDGATIEGVGNVSAETSRRLGCEAGRVVMTHDETGRILDVGRKTRVISPALRRALEHRDGGCRFPGCGLRFCDAHHVEHWADGGATKLENLVLLCRRHHRTVHEEGFGVEITADGSITFRDPFGHELPDAPPFPTLPERPDSPETARRLLAALLEDHAVEVDAMASHPQWDGSRFDVSWALSVLMN